jgi:hypothetical protein
VNVESPETLIDCAVRFVVVVTPSVEMPGVTVRFKNDGVSETVIVAIAFG